MNTLAKILLKRDICVFASATCGQAMDAINRNGLRGVFVVDHNYKYKGIVTDQDFRRNSAWEKSDSVERVAKYGFVIDGAIEPHLRHERLTERFNLVAVLDGGFIIDYIAGLSKSYIPIAEPSLSSNELKCVIDAVSSGWVSGAGRFIDEFEEALCAALGVKDNITAVTNGTVAIELALRAFGVGKEDEVIVPNLTFAATINAVLNVGATPVLVDVNEDDWNIDAEEVIENISQRCKAVICVDLYGVPTQSQELYEVCKQKNIKLIRDSAESLGGRIDGYSVCSFCDAATFSFFANKIVTTGEGGAVWIRDEEIFRKLSLIKNHGMSKTRKYWHEMVGTNARMTNVQAAIGVGQLARIDDLLDKRTQIHKIYTEKFSHYNLSYQRPRPGISPICWLFTVRFGSQHIRDLVAAALKGNSIDSRKVFYPLNEMPPFRSRKNFPVSKNISETSLSLPTYHKLSDDDIIRITDCIGDVLCQ
jgi:perosamine synthetase